MAKSRADLLLHPVRIRIAQAAAGRQLTMKELSDEITDVPTSSLYRHVGQLIDGGFLEVTDERQVRGTVERTFTLNTDQSALSAEDMADSSPDDHVGYFTAFFGSVLERASAYLRNPGARYGEDGFSYHLTPLWTTDEELGELREDMRALFEDYLVPGDVAGRRRRVLTTILVPDLDAPQT
jgi:DNA-binding transcriptional ArsR family regulator